MGCWLQHSKPYWRMTFLVPPSPKSAVSIGQHICSDKLAYACTNDKITSLNETISAQYSKK